MIQGSRVSVFKKKIVKIIEGPSIVHWIQSFKFYILKFQYPNVMVLESSDIIKLSGKIINEIIVPI